jgi:hypothetical protein
MIPLACAAYATGKISVWRTGDFQNFLISLELHVCFGAMKTEIIAIRTEQIFVKFDVIFRRLLSDQLQLFSCITSVT